MQIYCSLIIGTSLFVNVVTRTAVDDRTDRLEYKLRADWFKTNLKIKIVNPKNRIDLMKLP